MCREQVESGEGGAAHHLRDVRRNIWERFETLPHSAELTISDRLKRRRGGLEVAVDFAMDDLVFERVEACRIQCRMTMRTGQRVYSEKVEVDMQRALERVYAVGAL